MAKKFITRVDGHTIIIKNSPTICKMEIDGEVADVYFGLFHFDNIVLTGELPDAPERTNVKAVLGPGLLTMQCAIFVGGKLVYSSTEI